MSPHLPTVQFLIAYSMQRRRDQQSKTGRIRNEAKEVMQAILATKMSNSLLYHGLSHISTLYVQWDLSIMVVMGPVFIHLYRQLYPGHFAHH